jgi:hypothetical protein
MGKVVGSALVAALAGAALTALANPAAAGCALSMKLQLPVTMADGRPMVSAKIDGVDTRLGVSSGYYFNYVSRRKAFELGMRTSKYVEPGVHGVEGAEDDETVAMAKTLVLPGVTVPGVPFMVQDGDFSDGVVGRLGQNTFAFGDVEYDFAGDAIRVYQADGCGDDPMVFWDHKAGYSAITVEPQSENQPFILGTAFIDGKPLRVMFVTDTRRSVLTRDAARKLGLDLGSAGKADWASAAIGSFKVGDEEIRNTHLLVSPHDSVYYGGYADLYLGTDFFKSHHLYLSRSQHKLYFTYSGGKVFNLEAPTTAGDDYGDGRAVTNPTGKHTTPAESLRHIERL